MRRKPARTFGHAQTYPPDEDRPQGADQHDPAPALEPERRDRHQLPRQERDHRHGHELDRLIVGEGAAAMRFRHQLREIGVDRDQLDADADAGDEAPEIEPEGIGLERHDDARDRVPQQRQREDRAPAEAVGGNTEQHRADEEAGEERCDEARDAGGAEQARRGGRQDAARDKARRDIAGEQQIVELEEPAEREQQHAPPQRAPTSADDRALPRSAPRAADPRRESVVTVPCRTPRSDCVADLPLLACVMRCMLGSNVPP